MDLQPEFMFYALMENCSAVLEWVKKKHQSLG